MSTEYRYFFLKYIHHIHSIFLTGYNLFLHDSNLARPCYRAYCTFFKVQKSTKESVFDIASWCTGVSYIYRSHQDTATSGRLKIFPHNPEAHSGAAAAPGLRIKHVQVPLMREMSAVG